MRIQTMAKRAIKRKNPFAVLGRKRAKGVVGRLLITVRARFAQTRNIEA